MGYRTQLQTFKSYGFVPDGPCVGQEPPDEPPACTDASRVRLNVHPLDLCDRWCKAFEAAHSDIRVGVADDIEPAVWRIELHSVFEIGRDHCIDIKGEPIACRGGTGDPAQVLCDQTSGSISRRGVIDGEKFNSVLCVARSHFRRAAW